MSAYTPKDFDHDLATALAARDAARRMFLGIPAEADRRFYTLAGHALAKRVSDATSDLAKRIEALGDEHDRDTRQIGKQANRIATLERDLIAARRDLADVSERLDVNTRILAQERETAAELRGQLAIATDAAQPTDIPTRPHKGPQAAGGTGPTPRAASRTKTPPAARTAPRGGKPRPGGGAA
jgi:septal ring factor EnvC (AmiA/AmiB activator)